MSKEEADEVFEKWKPEFLGDSTKIKRALSTEKPSRAVIIKKVPLDVNDEMIQRCLETQFKDAKATRFIKRDSTKLGKFKIVLKSENDLAKALHQGLFIDSIYYKTITFVQNGIQIIRRFKCQKFDHISDTPQSDAFDNDGIHASMLKHFGIRMKLRLLKLFNSCWYESTWPWNSSRVIAIKKPGKSNYAFSSSYRPITLSSHVGKFFERMINRKLRTFFTSGKIIEKEQESFREKRSTVRSLYRMQL